MALNNNLKVKVFDLSLPLEERVNNAKVFNSIEDVAIEFSITRNKVKRLISSKERFFSEKRNKLVTLRHIN